MRPQRDFHLELFVFPDGTSVEIMVFDGCDEPGGEFRARQTGPGAAAPRRDRAPEPPASAAPDGATSPPASPAPIISGPEARACPLCGGRLVYPVDWQRASKDTWTLRLRCPDCETERDVVMDRQAVEELNRALYRAHREVADESRAMARRHFQEEAERIVAALDSGLIQPMDF